MGKKEKDVKLEEDYGDLLNKERMYEPVSTLEVIQNHLFLSTWP